MAGSGSSGYVNGTGLNAWFANPTNVVVGPGGILYVADANNHRIRKIAPDGSVTTVAGDGLAAHQDGFDFAARFRYPNDIAVDQVGDLYIADAGNNCIRKIVVP